MRKILFLTALLAAPHLHAALIWDIETPYGLGYLTTTNGTTSYFGTRTETHYTITGLFTEGSANTPDGAWDLFGGAITLSYDPDFDEYAANFGFSASALVQVPTTLFGTAITLALTQYVEVSHEPPGLYTGNFAPSGSNLGYFLDGCADQWAATIEAGGIPVNCGHQPDGSIGGGFRGGQDWALYTTPREVSEPGFLGLLLIGLLGLGVLRTRRTLEAEGPLDPGR